MRRCSFPGARLRCVWIATTPALLLLQRVRDEAHRFAVGHHRRRRSAQTTDSLLDGLPGVGREAQDGHPPPLRLSRAIPPGVSGRAGSGPGAAGEGGPRSLRLRAQDRVDWNRCEVEAASARVAGAVEDDDGVRAGRLLDGVGRGLGGGGGRQARGSHGCRRCRLGLLLSRFRGPGTSPLSILAPFRVTRLLVRRLVVRRRRTSGRASWRPTSGEIDSPGRSTRWILPISV